MPVLHQFDYIFGLGICFAFLDAWNIGANDVANSFATSVSSRSLTLRQAMLIASVCEFAGAVLVGSRVADTIRSKIISVKYFEEEPSVLMLGMLCALVGSSTWLTIATKLGLPVSTTHCIIGGVIGVGIATIGGDGVVWGWKGVAQVFAAWGVAPVVAGAFASTIFLLTKYLVLKRKNPLRAGFIAIPVYFGITSGILTMLVVWKGAPSLELDHWGSGKILGTIFGVAGGVVLICFVFFIPFLHRRLVKEDWQLKWYHFFLGPLLLKRGPVPPPPGGQGVQIVKNYYRGHKTREELEAQGTDRTVVDDIENSKEKPKVDTDDKIATASALPSDSAHASAAKTLDEHEAESLPWYLKPREGKWFEPKNLPATIARAFMHGVDKDVVSSQLEKSRLAGNLQDTHSRTPHFDNKTEHLYSFLQILTAATASFAHGSNDVSNAMGPLSTIYLIWHTGKLSTKAPVPIWVLVFGGTSIVLGLWTYGYNIMRNLGNRITLHSPSRGFSMELGSALTVVFATRLALPISTTQCIIGATLAVGLCTGDLKAINWRVVAWTYAGWLVTLPITGLISGLLMGFIINAPRFGKAL